MWIRVEAFGPLSSPENPSTVLNLFCQRVKEPGVLFALGRKTGDITFPTDKSVSRQHCVVRVRNGSQLVVQNEGKAGTYLAEPNVHAPKSTGDDSDTDATDDEGIISQRPSQQMALLGDGIVVDDFPLSRTTIQLWKQKSPIQMVKIDVGQSRILEFRPDQRSVLMQVGLNGSTLHLTWVPFHVTFSRVPKQIHDDWKEKLVEIGATEDAQITSKTTHLITSGNVTVSAKPLTACCRGIPIVTPDYLQALLNYATSSDPLPSPNDYKAPFDKTMALLEHNPANPKLMQGYLILTLETGEMEPLFQFSGAEVIPLHQLANDEVRMTKAKDLVETSNQVILVLSSRKRLFSKLASLDGIYGFKAEAWAKAVYTQSPQLKDTSGNPIPLAGKVPEQTDETAQESKQVHDSDTEDETPAMKQPKNILQTQEEVAVQQGSRSRKHSRDETQTNNSPIDSSSMTELQVKPFKRRRRDEVSTRILHEDKSLDEEPPSTRQEQQTEEAIPSSRNTRGDQTSKEEKPPTLDGDNQPNEEVSNDKAEDLKRSAEIPKQRTTIVRGPEPNNMSNPHSLLSKPNSNGWLVVAPKDNATRQAWWKKASKANAEEHDGTHFLPPAHSEQVVAILPPLSVSRTTNASNEMLRRRLRPTNGPDFKRFRKNIVPRKVDECEYITVQVVQARESEQQLRLEEDRRALEEQQRLADELFREIGGGATRRRRR